MRDRCHYKTCNPLKVLISFPSESIKRYSSGIYGQLMREIIQGPVWCPTGKCCVSGLAWDSIIHRGDKLQHSHF